MAHDRNQLAVDFKVATDGQSGRGLTKLCHKFHHLKLSSFKLVFINYTDYCGSYLVLFIPQIQQVGRDQRLVNFISL